MTSSRGPDTSIKVLDRFSFGPFGKLVDCNEHMSKSAPASSQWSNHIQSPNSKGLDEGMVFRVDASLWGMSE